MQPDKRIRSVKKDENAVIGDRLKAWRAQHSLTLAMASQRTGVASSTLSKIENNQVSVSYYTLKRICDGLGVPIEDFIAPGHKTFAPGRRSITRSTATTAFQSTQYKYEVHATDLSRKDMIPLEMTILARSADEFDDWNKHDGEEFVYVISGTIEVHTEYYAPVVLGQGDSIYFDSSMGHYYLSKSEEPAKVLSICYDPNAHKQSDVSEFFKAGRLEVRRAGEVHNI
jgi:transcriptional regulator with XRE-family HTH domain